MSYFVYISFISFLGGVLDDRNRLKLKLLGSPECLSQSGEESFLFAKSILLLYYLLINGTVNREGDCRDPLGK